MKKQIKSDEQPLWFRAVTMLLMLFGIAFCLAMFATAKKMAAQNMEQSETEADTLGKAHKTNISEKIEFK